MTKDYKLPRCWLGKMQSNNGAMHAITADEVNPDCTCVLPMDAFWCGEGHLTECHKGLNCEQAECSHLEKYEVDDQGDLP